MKINKNLLELETNDSFYNLSNIIKEYKDSHSNNDLVSLGIGDVSFPICKHIERKMIQAVHQEASNKYVGYGNYYGLKELREAIRNHEYPSFDVDEIYVSDGTKSDVGNILEMFDKDILVGIIDPTYPIYLNSSKSLSKKIEYIKSDSSFIPQVPNKHYDVIYMCSPNNPTGLTYNYEDLKKWIDYCNKEDAVIIYDNVYYCFIDKGIKSIYEVEGSRKCCIELRSFSKQASFTGIRCSYYVVPNELYSNINKYWKLRTINRFNGASYIAQIGALASYDKKAIKSIKKNIQIYKSNAAYLLREFKSLGYEVMGGENAPYLWIKCKDKLNGWDTFSLFLKKLEVVVIPGSIFGKSGENYFRVSALGKINDIKKAMERIRKYEENL